MYKEAIGIIPEIEESMGMSSSRQSLHTPTRNQEPQGQGLDNFIGAGRTPNPSNLGGGN